MCLCSNKTLFIKTGSGLDWTILLHPVFKHFGLSTSFHSLKNILEGTSLVVKWLRFQASNAGAIELIQGTKIPHATTPKEKINYIYIYIMCGMAKKKLYIYTYTSVYMGYSY